MKKVILSILLISFSLGILAQKKERQQEIGIAFNNLNSFALIYKSGTKKSLWRYNFLMGNFSNSNSNNTENNAYTDNKNFNLGFSLGKEFRKKITKKLMYRYGWDLGVNYYNGKNKNYNSITTSVTDSNSFSTSVNAVLGVNYKLSKSILFGVEVLPNISYTTGTQKVATITYKTTNWSAGFNNGGARLSLSYVF